MLGSILVFMESSQFVLDLDGFLEIMIQLKVRAVKMWLSHRDLIELIRRSILSDIKFGIYFGVSNSRGRFCEIFMQKQNLL